MEHNWILFAIGIGISVIILFLSYKIRDNTDQEMGLLLQRLKDISSIKDKPLSERGAKEILIKLDEMNRELINLRAEIGQLISEKGTVEKTKNVHKQSEPFSSMLHYNMFLERNSRIIELHEMGKSPKEIAKLLNKSIREIEMVLGLIK